MSPPIAELLIRADASPAIGSGHVMRCLALAQQWRAEGGRASFACAEIPDAIRTRLRFDGFDVDLVDVEAGSTADAAATLNLVRSKTAVVVIDGYVFASDYQDTLFGNAPALVVQDDYGQIGSYRADLILDQNLGATEDVYLDRPSTSRLLLGTDFVMLRREFLDAGGSRPMIDQTVHNILVTSGGADVGGLSRKILEALESHPKPLDITVVVGGAGPMDSVSGHRRPEGHHSIHVISDVPDMSTLMSKADMAISAAGSTIWELAYLGVPSILGVVANNQEAAASAVARLGAAVIFDGRSPESVDEIRHAVSALIDDHSRRAAMSDVGRHMVDGEGVRRVVQAIRTTAKRRHP